MTNAEYISKLVQISSKLRLVDDTDIVRSFEQFRDGDVKVINDLSEFLKLANADLLKTEHYLVTSACLSKVLLLSANCIKSASSVSEKHIVPKKQNLLQRILIKLKLL